MAREQIGSSHPPKYQADDDDDFDEPQQSCDLDDDDKNLPYHKS